MMKRFNFILACALALCGNPSANGQTGEPVSFLQVEFSIFPLGPADWEGILFAPDGDPERGTQKLRFNPHERTLGFSYSGPAPLRFYKRILNDEGASIYRTIGEVDLGTGVLRDPVILFFAPASEESETHRIFHMTDSATTFPNETIVFFNSTNVLFQGILGDERITLGPGASEPLDVRDYFDEPAPIGLVIEHNDDLHRVLMNKIHFSADRRTLMILREPANPRSLRIRTQRLTEFTGTRSATTRDNEI